MDPQCLREKNARLNNQLIGYLIVLFHKRQCKIMNDGSIIHMMTLVCSIRRNEAKTLFDF